MDKHTYIPVLSQIARNPIVAAFFRRGEEDGDSGIIIEQPKCPVPFAPVLEMEVA